MNRFSRFTLTVLILLFVTAPCVGAEEVLYARYPALSPDGGTMAFTYQGDIWTVPAIGGEATRLTVHEGEDIRPYYSPDGRWILFTSNRFNNNDVFVIPAEGGRPVQLTFHSISDIGCGFTPGSDSVLFTSSRDGWRDIFKVSLEGGTPVALQNSYLNQEYNGSISSDGRYLVFNTGSGLSRWSRRDLRTSGNADIYVADRTAREFQSRRLTDWPNHDVWPVLNEQRAEVYFVSCRGDWAQVWKVPFAGGEAVQMTTFDGDGVQWLNANPQGTMLAFEQNFRVWTMDPATGEPSEVKIEITTDERSNTVTKGGFKDRVQNYALSPDEKKIVASVHGELFVLPAEDPEDGRRVTYTSARERFPAWGADSRTIYYTSDRNGNYDIFSADVLTGQERRLTESAENDTKPVVSPDGKYVAWYRGLDKIIRYDVEDGKETVWITGSFLDYALEPTQEYNWSPDSKWLAFTMAGATHETDIYVADLDGNVHNVSRFMNYCYRPRFSSDGKLLYFSNWQRSGETTYQVRLAHEPVEFYESSFDSLFAESGDKGGDSKDKTNSKDKRDKKNKDGKGDDDPPEPVVIDFERIELRRTLAFDLTGSSEYPVLTPDGETYLFVASLLGEPEIWSVNTDDDLELKQLTHSGKSKTHLTLTGDGKHVFFLEKNTVKKMPVAGGKTTSLSFRAAMYVDVVENNRQKLTETWQMFNSYFYDSTFRGVDWEQVYHKYAPLVDHVRTEDEFRNVVFELMGEAMGSHVYIYSKASGPVAGVRTGETGMEFDYGVLETTGHYLIRNVVYDSPADLAGIRAGQYLVAVGGERLTNRSNVYPLLAGTRDKRLGVSVAERSGDDGTELYLKPSSKRTIDEGRYQEWLTHNRTLVDSLSEGRLAYIHIPGMNMKWQKVFEAELVSRAEPKEGLVLDVRDNGGGWTAVNILGSLVKSPYIMRGFRGHAPISENKYRSKAYEKPMTLLINNYSGSNAEIFAEGFRKLGLGTIVGTPTGSGVIGTSSYYLIDGTRIRRPSTAALTTEGEDTDLVPRQPDIFVEMLPDDYLNGRDPQLEKAVEELLKKL